MDFGSITMQCLCTARWERGNVYTSQLINQRRIPCANFLSRQNVPVGQLQVDVRTDDGRRVVLTSILGLRTKQGFACINLTGMSRH